MVTKVDLTMLAEKVIKNADLVGNTLTLNFSDGSSKDLTVGGGEGEDPGNIMGKSGTLVGAVGYADFTQNDIELMSSDPFLPTPILQLAVDVKEVGNYYCFAFFNPNGCHVSKAGEVVTTTYYGKNWTYNTRTTGVVAQIQMDDIQNQRSVTNGSDTFVPGGYSTTLTVSRIIRDVTIGTHVFKLCLYQPAAADACACRCVTFAVFRI